MTRREREAAYAAAVELFAKQYVADATTFAGREFISRFNEAFRATGLPNRRWWRVAQSRVFALRRLKLIEMEEA